MNVLRYALEAAYRGLPDHPERMTDAQVVDFILSAPSVRAGLIRAVEEAIETAHLDVISYQEDPHGWTLTDHFAAVKIVEGVLA